MPLKLVTGPANAAKAGEVLGGFRRCLGARPILVVPDLRDVEHNQRELAAAGAVFGGTVLRFAWLFEEIARRCARDAGSRRASRLQRELLVRESIARARLRELAPSARHRGFAVAAARLVAELERSMVPPDELAAALARSAGGARRGAYADELARIYAAYHATSQAAGLADAERFAWRAVDDLAAAPAAWAGTPLFLYGFDDFTEVELRAIELLAGPGRAEVVLSLPYEEGRAAFAAVRPTLERLTAMGAERTALPPRDDHYDDRSRAQLHHLERHLFGSPPARLDPGPAVRLHVTGGERAEVELVAAEVLRLLRSGTRPGDVAVVFRDPHPYASLVEQSFSAYGVPFSLERTLPFPHTALGRGVLAVVRCALGDGEASPDDLLAYLRTPGLLDLPQLADRLEVAVRREGARTAARARVIWEQAHPSFPLEAIDRLAAARGPAAFLSELERLLDRLFGRPHRRRAPLLSGPELVEAKALRAARAAVAELRELVEAGAAPSLDRQGVARALAELRVWAGDEPDPGRVQVVSPEAIRARRFAAVFLCGLQEGEFPRRPRPEPFLSDADRVRLREAGGPALRIRDDELERERHLFYSSVSRAERLVVLSTRESDEEGRPQARSFFVDDVLRLFDPVLEEVPLERSISDVTWRPEEAPTVAEWERAVALAGPRAEPAPAAGLDHPAVLEELRARAAFSAGALETFADCPVKWFVERYLKPEQLEPDPEAMVRGSYAHRVLQLTFERLGERTGTRRVTAANLAIAERVLLSALREAEDEFRISPRRTRVRAAVRKLEFDLLHHLSEEVEQACPLEPRHLELEFGTSDTALPPLELGDGAISVSGRIDRVDADGGGTALVRDYKSGRSRTDYSVQRWEAERRLQVPLYMLAVQRLAGLEVAGGVYVPLAGKERRPRGMLSEASRDELGDAYYANDWRDRDRFAAELERAERTACELVDRLQSGTLAPCPDTCAWRGGCSHPSICRVEG